MIPRRCRIRSCALRESSRKSLDPGYGWPAVEILSFLRRKIFSAFLFQTCRQTMCRDAGANHCRCHCWRWQTMCRGANNRGAIAGDGRRSAGLMRERITAGAHAGDGRRCAGVRERITAGAIAGDGRRCAESLYSPPSLGACRICYAFLLPVSRATYCTAMGLLAR